MQFSQKPSCLSASRHRSALGTRDNYTQTFVEHKTGGMLQQEVGLSLYLIVFTVCS